MPALKPLSREYRIYLAIWRKAYRERDFAAIAPIVVHASNFTLALAMKQGMYRAIRPYRFGEQTDEELRLASDLFIVSCAKEENPRARHTLILKPRQTLTELEKELVNLGLDSNDLLTVEEKLANMEIEGLMTEGGTVGPPARSTPFYTRED